MGALRNTKNSQWLKVRTALIEHPGMWFDQREMARMTGLTANYSGRVMRELHRQFPDTFERKQGSYRRALYRKRI